MKTEMKTEMKINKNNERCPGCNNLNIWSYDSGKYKRAIYWCPECGASSRHEGKRLIINLPNSVNRRKFYPLNEGTENNEYKLIIYHFYAEEG